MDASSAVSAPETSAGGCHDLASIFASCTAKIDGLYDLPESDQANCYCCRTSAGITAWTDDFDNYASVCAYRASRDGSEELYTRAQSFTTFCEDWSDVCDKDSFHTQVPTSSKPSATGTVLPGSSPDTPTQTNPGQGAATVTQSALNAVNHSSGLSGGEIAGIAVGVVGAVLLALFGAFWMWRKKSKGSPAETAEPPTIQTSENFRSGGTQRPMAELEQPYTVQPSSVQPVSPMFQSPPPGVAHELHGQDRSRFFELPAEHSTTPREIG